MFGTKEEDEDSSPLGLRLIMLGLGFLWVKCLRVRVHGVRVRVLRFKGF